MSAIANQNGNNAIAELRNQFTKLQPQLALALPAHVQPDRFIRIVMTAVQQNPALVKCDRESLFGACMKAAQDGLLPDGREAFLNCYFSKRDNKYTASYQPMIGGILKKIRQSGELKQLSAAVVRQGDEFSYSVDETGEHFRHVPGMDNDDAPVTCVYAAVWTKDGGVYFKVMSVGQIEKARAVSRAKDSGPWVDWWDEMALKTVIRNLAKRLPMSAEIEQVIQRVDDLTDLPPITSEHGKALGTAALKARMLEQQALPALPESLLDFDEQTGEIAQPETVSD